MAFWPRNIAVEKDLQKIILNNIENVFRFQRQNFSNAFSLGFSQKAQKAQTSAIVRVTNRRRSTASASFEARRGAGSAAPLSTMPWAEERVTKKKAMELRCDFKDRVREGEVASSRARLLRAMEVKECRHRSQHCRHYLR